MTREIKADAAVGVRFPLGVALAGVLATGAALVVSALGVQWGAAPPQSDALQLSWVYVNVALVWTWLLVWPAMTLRRQRLAKVELAWEFSVLLVAAVPALGVAAFLSGVTGRMIWMAAVLQAAIGLLAMGAMAWRRVVGPGVVGGLLAALAAALPVLGYLWAEFFAAASQGWRAFIPWRRRWS